MKNNGTLMQYFEWHMPDGILWKQLAGEANALAEAGFTAVWIPPSYKGSGGKNDVGYAVYDLYDLGEFDQKGSVPTKYGTKEELQRAVAAAHDAGLQVYADIVLDHKMGADGTETVPAKKYNLEDRTEAEGKSREIDARTYFSFPGRRGKYSDFEWHWNHFVAVGRDEMRGEEGVYKFRGKEWQENVDEEKGNYDYLMGADIDLNNPDVQEELLKWGAWFLDTTGVDGFRLDAVKHMESTFYRDWLTKLRAEKGRELFAVGEYWNGELAALQNYLQETARSMSLFDVPLHFRFQDASKGGDFDMRTIFDGTLTQSDPDRSVPFVDNHDTQPGQSLESWVDGWFKPLAYALILLRRNGYPCVFYGDYYGIPHDNLPPLRDRLDPMLKARMQYAYGEQHDYFDDPHLVGWTMEGDGEHANSGLAVVMTNAGGGGKEMFVGENNAGKGFWDCLSDGKERVVIGEDGNARFPVNDGSVAVWIPEV